MKLNEINFNRPQSFNNKIVFIDGFSGSGKSMIAPILSSYNSAEIWKLDHVFEYCLKFISLGAMSAKAAETLMRMYIDIDTYNLRIGRDINFRETDDSSAQKNLLEERYRERSTFQEGDEVTKAINREVPINIFLTHYILDISAPLFSSLGDRLKLFIVPTRHPCWLLENWVNGNWDTRIGKDPRDLHLTYKLKEGIYPYYTMGWEDKYDSASSFEKAIYVISSIMTKQDSLKKNIPNEILSKIMVIPFEKFAVSPQEYLENIADILDSSLTKSTTSIMREMNLPREFPQDLIEKQTKHIFDLMKANNVSRECEQIFKELVLSYENRYLEDSI